MLQYFLANRESMTIDAVLYLMFGYALLILVFLPLHEFAHAGVAYLCGDRTALWHGRLTLNPLKHLDPWGTAMMLLIGGLYLIFRKVISWQIPVAYIGTVAVLTFLFPQGNDALTWMLYNVLGGGLFLGAFFMATDYVTSPVTKKGQLIFGLGCGLITVFIRYFGSYPEGVCYSILVMNCCTWIIDKYTKPTRFGVDKKAAKEAAKK